MFESLLAQLARAFDAAEIPYMVIGGQAVLLHGEARLTKDIDITIGVDIDQLDRATRAIAAIGLVAIPEDVENFVAQTRVLPLKDLNTGIRVDVVFSFSPYEAGAMRRSVSVSIGGGFVRFSSAEDLIIHKMIAGRPRDLEDVRGVLAKNPQLDVGMIKNTLRQFEEALEQNFVEALTELLPK